MSATGVRAGNGLVTITPLKLPGAPTNVSAKPGFASATVLFSPPPFDPNPAVTSYTVVSSPGASLPPARRVPSPFPV